MCRLFGNSAGVRKGISQKVLHVGFTVSFQLLRVLRLACELRAPAKAKTGSSKIETRRP